MRGWELWMDSSPSHKRLTGGTAEVSEVFPLTGSWQFQVKSKGLAIQQFSVRGGSIPSRSQEEIRVSGTVSHCLR